MVRELEYQQAGPRLTPIYVPMPKMEFIHAHMRERSTYVCD